jgi:hypothetical protein
MSLPDRPSVPRSKPTLSLLPSLQQPAAREPHDQSR